MAEYDDLFSESENKQIEAMAAAAARPNMDYLAMQLSANKGVRGAGTSMQKQFGGVGEARLKNTMGAIERRKGRGHELGMATTAAQIMSGRDERARQQQQKLQDERIASSEGIALLKSRAAYAKATKPKALTSARQEDLTNITKMADTMDRLTNPETGYQDSYSGGAFWIDSAQGYLARNASWILEAVNSGEEPTKQEAFWSSYDKYLKLVERRIALGTQMPKHEQKDWATMNINRSMQPKEIRRRLKEQATYIKRNQEYLLSDAEKAGFEVSTYRDAATASGAPPATPAAAGAPVYAQGADGVWRPVP